MRAPRISYSDWYAAMADYMTDEQMQRFTKLAEPYYSGNGDIDDVFRKAFSTSASDYMALLQLKRDVNLMTQTDAFKQVRLDLYRDALRDEYPEATELVDMLNDLSGDKDTVVNKLTTLIGIVSDFKRMIECE